MKRLCVQVLISCACLVSLTWAQPNAGAQQPATKPLLGKPMWHPLPRQTAGTTTASLSRSLRAQANPADAKTWELGVYPGGTWFTTWHINDFGVMVGRGDVPPLGPDGVGSTHTLLVPLIGTHAGKWIDLGTLGGEEPTGSEESICGISNTGLVASRSTALDGQMHAVAWTAETGMLDLGTLRDSGDPQYAAYNSSAAAGPNKFGTLIVGGSWIGEDPNHAVPVVWTPSIVWQNWKLVTKWTIHKLDTSAFPEFTEWGIWGVNDYGQIVGTGLNDDASKMTAVVWNLRPDGKGWKLMALPSPPSTSPYPLTQAYGINDKGEIAGVASSTDFSVWLPLLWKPLDRKATTYSQPIELPLPEGGFTGCENVGLNDLGDMVGDCWNDTTNLPARWTMKDLTVAEIIQFPMDWGYAWGVNNDRIASITYGGSVNCSPDTVCGGAVRLTGK